MTFRPFHEVIPEILRPLVLHLKGERAEMAVGGIVTILGLLREADIPPKSIPDIVAACQFVLVGVSVVEDDYVNLRQAAEDTLKNLNGRGK